MKGTTIELKSEYDIELGNMRKQLAVKKHELKRLQANQKKMESIPGLSEEEKQKLQGRIDTLLGDIITIGDAIVAMKAGADDEAESHVKTALNTVRSEVIGKDPSIAYSIKDGEFVFIGDRASTRHIQNVAMTKYNPMQFSEYLAKLLKLNISDLPHARLKQLFINNDRAFEEMRYSLNKGLWKDDEIYLPFDHYQEHFIHNFTFQDGDLEPEAAAAVLTFYDALLYSVSGGKTENQTYLEKWIVHKVVNYHKQVTTPDLIIVADIGGNGKGILMGILARMFPRQLIGRANTKTLNNNFNSIMLGKLLVFFDDQDRDKYDLETIKELSGAETMIYEPKGKDQYEAEKTHSSVFFSQKLPFRLSPNGDSGGVDRRFSIMRTNITFFDSLIAKHSDIDAANVKAKASEIINTVLYDRVNIAIWFKHLRSKYPNIDADFELDPLHGTDYETFKEDQKDDMEVVWDRLVLRTLQAGGLVPVFVIKEMLLHLAGKEVPEKTIKRRLKELAVLNKLNIQVERKRFDIVSGAANIVGLREHTNMQKSAVSVVGSTCTEFDWSEVSKGKFTGKPDSTGKYIADEEYIF